MPKNKWSQNRRLRYILDLLQTGEELTVLDACDKLGVSEATIRRDFLLLVSEGKALKTWGGVARDPKEESFDAMSRYLGGPTDVNMLEAKIKIAESASSLIRDGDVVILDGGSTTMQMTPYISHKRIKVLTNSIALAYKIDKEKGSHGGAEVFLTGGILYPESGLLVGPIANQNIKMYHANITFLSCGALDVQGPSNNNQLVVETEQAMIAQSEKKVLLADSSKFNQKNMSRICTFKELDHLITDVQKELDAVYKEIKRQECNIVLV